MGHKSKKRSEGVPPPPPPPFNMNNLGQLFNNVDVNSMSNMLNNMDLNQVMSMFSKSFNPSQNNPQEATPPPNTEDANPLNNPKPNLDPVLPPNDPTVLVLNSLKPFLPPDKCIIIDNMIQLIGIKSVMDTLFPPAQVKVKENPQAKKEEEKASETSKES